MSDTDTEAEYAKPWIRHAVLWVGFAVLVVVGIWTVVLPAVEDSPVDPEQSGEEASSAEDESAEAEGDGEAEPQTG